MPFYTYILQSEVNKGYYIGQTQNLNKRLFKHNKGYSKYTKAFAPWRLIWFKTFKSRKEAYKCEQILKGKKSRKNIQKYMKENPCVPGADF